MTVRLSIIIPAYNEADRIRPALDACDRLCDTLPFESEIIVVDDGSTDDSAETVTSLGSLRVRLIRHTDNRGKGAAVRTGMLAASGTYRLFTDADNSTPIAFALPFIKRLDSGADVS